VPTLEMADADWQQVLATNVSGTWHVCQVLLPARTI
jgi:NAD(P)-dependent dehydrogenase (short-subunit alcohol dehydrogenase family)